MKQVHLNRSCLALLIAATVFLAGCSTLPQTVPVAVIYDRDLDEFHVEVVEVPEGETPVYPDTLGFVTLIDGERRDGLIPTTLAYDYVLDRGSKIWSGPWWVQYKDSKWRIYLVQTTFSVTPKPNSPVEVDCRLDEKIGPPYPVYLFHIDGAYHHLQR